MHKKDPLLDHPFLSDAEITSLLQDIDAIKDGRITGVVGSEFWYRALTEIARRQHMREIRVSRSLTYATWLLVLVTWLLAIATVIKH